MTEVHQGQSYQAIIPPAEDDLLTAQMSLQAARARGLARELEALMQQLAGESPEEDDLPRQIAHARDQATTIYSIADTMDHTIHAVKSGGRGPARKQPAARMQALGQQLAHVQQAATQEKTLLSRAGDEATVHKAAEPQARVEAAPKPAVKPAPVAMPPVKPSRKAVAAAVATPVAVRPEKPVETVAEAVPFSVAKAQQVAQEVVHRVKETYHQTAEAVQVTAQNTAQAASRMARETLESVSVGVQRHVVAPVKQGAHAAYETLSAAKQQALQWARGAKKRVLGLMEGDAAPTPASPATSKPSMLCRAMQQAAAIGLPLAAEGQGLACPAREVALPTTPPQMPVPGGIPGLN